MFRFNQLAILLNTAIVYFAILCSSALTTSCKSRSTSKVRTLPNEGFGSPEASSEYYKNLFNFFESANLDLTPQQTPLNLSWPLTTEKILLTRFGTPTIADISTPGNAVKLAYFHEALDIVRSSENSDDEVHAPVTGRATVIFDGSPDGHDVDTYGTAVAIYDPVSHYVISLLHVSPSEQIKPGQLTDVQLGSVIGQLAPVQSMKPEYEKKFRHAHVAQINVRDKTLVNPLKNFREYKDTTRPTIKEIYITDDAGAKHSDLISGNLDIVADAFDRDDESRRNFEVTFFSFKATDDKGNTLKTAQSCNLNFLTEKSLDASMSKSIYSLLDLGNAIGQVSDTKWIDFKTDAANPDRSFRYALTNLTNAGNSCEVVPDAEGLVTITDSLQSLNISLTVADQHGNVTTTTKRLTRASR